MNVDGCSSFAQVMHQSVSQSVSDVVEVGSMFRFCGWVLFRFVKLQVLAVGAAWCARRLCNPGVRGPCLTI